MKKILSILCLLLLIGVFTYAQEFGAVKGTVVDEEGTPLPGVTVSLNGSKIAPMSVISSARGNFRFMALPVASDYVLRIELAGFKTVIRERLPVSFGRDIVLSITLEVTAIEEEITVIGQSPVIDTKRTQVGVNITDEMIMSLPTARNPWVIMAMVPGMLISSEDVGGNEAGQQSDYSGHGSVFRDNTWSIDGANITDNAALGAAPAYLNLSSYEELQIAYGNNDVKSQTGGVQLNFVSKRGGNAFSGTFYLDIENEKWQSSNATAELDAYYDPYNPGVNRIYLYGANFGGPIIKDRAWFYGSWGLQDLDARNIDGTSDKTWLVSGYGKINVQVGPTTRAEFYLQYDDKLKWGRIPWFAAAAEMDVTQSAWNQDGPGYFYKGEVEQIFGNLYINAKAIWMDMAFYLHPLDPGLGIPLTLSYYPDYFASGGADDYGTTRTNLNINATGNYFAEDVLGADHEIKFGVDYLVSTVTSYDYYQGNLYMYYYGPDEDDFFTSGEYWEVDVKRDVNLNMWLRRFSFFVQDTMTFGKLSINLGLRYDNETSMVKDQAVPASPFLPNLLPALTIEKLDPGINWNVLSPRISFIYDITGDGKNVLKLNLARYGSQEGFGMADHLNPMGWGGVGVYWDDLDGNDVATNDELFGEDVDGNLAVPTADTILWASGVNVDDPTSVSPANKIDPDFNSPLLDELTVSFERELITDFALRAEFFYKKAHNQIWDRNMMLDGTLEEQSNYTNEGTESETGQTIWGSTEDYFYEWRTNYPNSFSKYLAGQVVLLKRLSNRWMLNASFTYSSWDFFYKGDYIDPHNVSFYDKGVNSWVNSRWQLKCSGMYQFPIGLNVSWVFRAREGYVLDNYANESRPNIGTESFYDGVRGDDRLPTFYELDLRLEKVFQVSDFARVTLSVDTFNVTNSNHELDRQKLLTSTIFGQTTKVLNPRVFRFGIRFDF